MPLSAVQSLILTELVLYVYACMCVCICEYVYACECVYVLGAAECSSVPYLYGTGCSVLQCVAVPLSAVRSLIHTELVLYVCMHVCVCEYVYVCEHVYILVAAECSSVA